MLVRKRFICWGGKKIIRFAVKFIFRNDNIQLGSRSAKKVRCYPPRIGISINFISSAPAAYSSRLQDIRVWWTSVDFIIGILHYDNCTTLQMILEKEMRNISIWNHLLTKPMAVSDFTKYGITYHIGKEGCCLQNADYEVLSASQGCSGTARVSNCGNCPAPYCLVNRMRNFEHRKISFLDTMLNDSANTFCVLNTYI